MNKGLNRIAFVGSFSALAWAALLACGAARAQIVADPAAPGAQRPTVLRSANGLPQVNIQTPSSAGVSRNSYIQFDVQRQGAILNNSRTNTSTQLGGMVTGNPWLATGEAKVILNEVNSRNPSYINGFVEVAGRKAEVVIANPAGIRVNGGGFLNASGVTLTTGTPVMNSGSLESFRVTRGMVSLEGLGLDASTASYTTILARAAEINASLWANKLTVVTGANEVKALASGAEATMKQLEAEGQKPLFMLDVGAVGGMYAGHIYLVGTEKGLGVNTQGTLNANQDMVLLADGWLVNKGSIQAKEALALQAAGVTNSGATAAIGGQGSTSISSSAGIVNMQGASIASAGTVTLTTAGALQNSDGTISGAQGANVSAGSIDNTQGLIQSGGHLRLDASQGITNTQGQILASQNNAIRAASLTGDGKVQAGGDLSLALTNDFSNTGSVSAGGSASIATSGSVTNSGQINAGSSLSITGKDIENKAGGEIVGGASTQLTADNTVINRGLIDGGRTRIDAASVTNVGTGRIYGDQVSIGASTLTNDAETVAGVRSDAVIAARERLDIGVSTLNNREGALLFSAGSGANALNIGGALDASGHAVGSASVVNNASATIESLGGLTIATGSLNNTNGHFSIEAGSPVVKDIHEVKLEYLADPLPYEKVYFYQQRYPYGWIDATMATHVERADGHDIYANMGPGECWCLVAQPFTANWIEYVYQRRTVEDIVKSSAPGVIRAGGDLSVRLAEGGVLRNDKSQVTAGGALTVQGGSVENIGALGTRTVADVGISQTHGYRAGNAHGVDDWKGWDPYRSDSVTQVALPVTTWQANTAGGSATQVPGKATLPASSGIRTIPTSALYRVSPNPGGRYLVETDPRFTNNRQWLSSDYMLTALGYDPDAVQKRLGDGFYEQRLVREQIAQLTGRLQIDGLGNNLDAYQALLDSGVTYAKEWQLIPGVALTAEQMARLTSDIVWLVAQQVQLPDGSMTTALVPQVYLRPRIGDLDTSGTLLAGRDVKLDLSGNLTNSGTVAGREALTIDARTVENLQGRMQANDLAIHAEEDIRNIGGTLQAQNSATLDAGRDITLITTTEGSSNNIGNARYSRQGIDRVAGVYVTGDGGSLVANAGRDVNLVAGVLSSSGSIDVAAGRDLNLSTVTTSSSEAVTWDARNRRSDSRSDEVGAVIQGAGDVTLTAGASGPGDLNARAATVQSGGALDIAASGNITIESGVATREMERASQSTRKNTLQSRTFTSEISQSSTSAIASSLGGDTVTIRSGRDLSVIGSNVVSDRGTTLVAGGDVNIVAATETLESSRFVDVTKKGVFGAGGGAIGFTIGKSENATDVDTRATAAAASTVGSIGGDVVVVAGETYRQTGSDVLAPQGNVFIQGQQVEITEARQTRQTTTEQRASQSGLTVAVSNPVIAAAQTVARQAEAAKDTDDPRMKALAAANSAFAVKNAASAIQSGQKPDAGAAAQAGGIDVSVTLGGSSSRNTVVETTESGRGSSVMAGGNLTIQATGAGPASDLVIRGSDVMAGRDANLRAEGDVRLEASQGTSALTGSSSSSSGGVGVTVGSNGFGVTVSASGGRGGEAGDDTFHDNSHVTAGGTVAIQSGADTTIRGAVVKGETVKADVGGKLLVESLQDTSHYDSRQQSIGGSITIGPAPGGSFSASHGTVESEYRSVAEQSGIKAGDGGFQVKAGGNTELVGAVIASSQAAVDERKNSFQAGGGVTTRDLQNEASYQAESVSIGGGVGTQAKQLGLSGLGVGVGSDGGSASSITTAGISGIAGDKSVRSTDAETGIARIFDKEKVQKEVAAQVLITQEFGRNATKAIGEYANEKHDELMKTDPQEAAKWAEGGVYRVGLHALTAGLAGGIEAAVGTASSQYVIADVGRQIAEMELPHTVKQALAVAAGTAIGAAFGGEYGAAGGFNATANNYLTVADLKRKGLTKEQQQALSLQNNRKVEDACIGASRQVCGTAIAAAADDIASLKGYKAELQQQLIGTADASGRLIVTEQLKAVDSQIASANNAIRVGLMAINGGNFDISTMTEAEIVAMGFAFDSVGAAAVRSADQINALITTTRLKAEAEQAKERQKTENNATRDGGTADPSQPMSATGNWKPAAELTPAQANALVNASLPEGLKIMGSTNANLDNANALANSYKAPFVPNSQVVQVVTTESVGFVRVYVTMKDGSGQAGSWMMRADDIAGLTPTQIASKFGLPQVPTMITDVTIPPGTTMNVSAANGISPWDAKGHYTGGNGGGGGVQFQVTTKVSSPKEFEGWFNNPRPLK